MILYGASGHAKVIIDILNACGTKIKEIFDDNFSQIKILHGINVCKPEPSNEKMIISIGNNNIRKRISESGIAREYGTAIHPSAIVSPFAEIGEGTVIMQGAIIQAGAKVGKHCIINTGATVDHDCTIGDYAHISPNATLCGNVTIGEGSQIGVGASIIPGITVGKWSLICAGSVVTTDIPNKCVAAGNFCQVKRFIKE